MRVLLLNQVFHPDPQSTGQHLGGLAEGLVRRGHTVTVLTSRRSYDDARQTYPARETWRGIEIIRVWNTALGHQAKWRRALDFLSFLLAATLRACLLPRADVVVTLTTPPLLSVLGGVLAKLWRARFVYWVMDLNPDEAIAIGWLKADGLFARLLEAASRWSLHAADQIIALDSFMRERLIRKGIAPEKIAAIPVWMQPEIGFDPAGRERFRHAHGLEGKYVVMYSGNHTPVHPLETLLGAARLLRGEPRIHFCFIGGGIEWGRLKRLAESEAWPHATFLGYQPLADLSASLSAADTQVVVLGDALVGIVHPCKIYNFLAADRPFVTIGPAESHLAEIIRQAGVEALAASFRHGESAALAEELRQRLNVPRRRSPARGRKRSETAPGPRRPSWKKCFP